MSKWEQLPPAEPDGSPRFVLRLADGVRLRVAGGAWGLFVNGSHLAGGSNAPGDTPEQRLANAMASAESWVRDFALGLLRGVVSVPDVKDPIAASRLMLTRWRRVHERLAEGPNGVTHE